jgi:3-methyladenine DNA glycosylase AlkD
MQYQEVIHQLQALAKPEAVEGMARFGIKGLTLYGISIPELRILAKQVGSNSELAHHLWGSSIHEARILASMVEVPARVTEAQMEQWAQDFDSWDLCDQCCGNLFDKTPWAYAKATGWSSRPEEFVKRAGFALMAYLAVHDKKASDEKFLAFLLLIQGEAPDPRNFVKKAVNWALRQIGKRNLTLNEAAVGMAREIGKLDSKSARWIATDALRELTSEKVQQKLKEFASGHIS